MYLIIQTLTHCQALQGRILSRIIAGRFFVVTDHGRASLFTVDDAGQPLRLGEIGEYASTKAAYKHARRLAK